MTYMAHKAPTSRIREGIVVLLGVNLQKMSAAGHAAVSRAVHCESTPCLSWTSSVLTGKSLYYLDYLRCLSRFYFTLVTVARTVYSECSFVQLLKWVRFNFQFCDLPLLHEESLNPFLFFYFLAYDASCQWDQATQNTSPWNRPLFWLINYHQKLASARILD